MRRYLWLGLLALAATTADSNRPAKAVPGPWCLYYSVGSEVMSERCNFPDFETCRQERSFWGTTAFCTENPRYFWNAPNGEPRYRKSKRRTNH